MTVATDHPTGQEHQIPVAPRPVFDRRIDRTTRRIRSVKVAAIKAFIRLAPLRIPSATSLVEMTR